MEILQNYSLKNLNTFGIGVSAKYFSSFNSANDLKLLLEDKKNVQRRMILGGGSNILFTKDYDGLVLKNNIEEINIIREDEDYVYVNAGAGVSWHGFVMHCVNNSFGGVENLSLIPGNVGASPMQNIGAYGVEIKDVFYELEALHLDKKNIQKFSAEECEFGYRESIFKKKLKDKFAILNVTYRLRKKPVFNTSYGAIEQQLEKSGVTNLTIKAVSDAVIAIRTAKLPDSKIIGNAGSFFKNPVISKEQSLLLQQAHRSEVPIYHVDENHIKIPAGWMIEQCGWKGFRNGDAGCYDKQALVLVNYGNATGKEIYDLSEEIKISVKEKFGIDLEREVNIV